MNKKLNITAVEYQHRTRQQAKQRTLKFREQQERRGYKNLTIYLSEPFRDELERLSAEHGMNRQTAMDHIFDIYQQAIHTGLDTLRHNVRTDQPPDTTGHSGEIESPDTVTADICLDTGSAPAPERKPDKSELESEAPATMESTERPPESITTESTTIEPESTGYPNSQTLLFDDESESDTGGEIELKPFNKAEICKIIVELRDNKGMAYQAIAKELKALGYRPKTKGKDTFHHSTVAGYYKDGKEKT